MSAGFATQLLAWWDRHGRKDLPWQQHRRSPYRVWLSEVMLQQTQVTTVMPYFERFVQAFPALPDLAAAPLERVLALWSGLGYYGRARNLHRAARLCFERHGGMLPDDMAALSSLPGIGRSTAAAILAQAHGQRHAILDGNVARVLARFHGVHGEVNDARVARTLWTFAESHLPRARLADYTQAIMDLGATVCVRRAPACARCPLLRTCVARAQNLQHVLPTPRQTRVLPERSVAMLLVRDAQDRVLLECRPPTGVWGGLYSLPEFEDVAAVQANAGERLGLDLHEIDTLAPLRHSFTHFRLAIHPVAARVSRTTPHIADNERMRWTHHDELGGLGMPAPIRRLLLSFREHH